MIVTREWTVGELTRKFSARGIAYHRNGTASRPSKFLREPMGSGLPYRRHEDLDALLNLLRTAAGAVAQQVGTEHPNLARLSAPDTSPIWFDTKRADGPIWLLTGEKPAA